MTTHSPVARRDDPPCGCEPDPDEQPPGGNGNGNGNGDGKGDGCDPHLIDCLKCHAEGVAKRATYNADTQPALEQARKDYDTARTAYRMARQDNALKVQDLQHEIRHLVERIRCMIKQQRVVDCLDEAYKTVIGWLEKCPSDEGCCAEDECEFDTSCPDVANDQPAVRQAAYRAKIDAFEKHVAEARECFERLVGEPTALTDRIATAKAEVDGVNADLAADAATIDLKRVYARALVARRMLKRERVWGGFDDAAAYVDCLCKALTCWTKGWAAVSELTGMEAVAQCEANADADRCTQLLDKTVEEILAVYDRLCAQQECEEEAEAEEKRDAARTST